MRVAALIALVWLALLAYVSPLQAQHRARDHQLKSSSGNKAAVDAAPRTQLPLSVHVYTSQVQLGSVQWAASLAAALGAEYPRWQRGALSLFPAWKLGFEHHFRSAQKLKSKPSCGSARPSRSER